MTWRYFTKDEFACQHCGENLIDTAFVDKLDELRERCGFALPVTSGYRCPDHNERVSTTWRDGPHTTGRAADLKVSHAAALVVLEHALALGFTGIGLNQKGAGRFVHVDMVPRLDRACWTY